MALAPSAEAVLIQDPDRTHARGTSSDMALPAGGAETLAAIKLSAHGKSGASKLVSSDPCAQQTGWLPQEKDGVLFCGTLADFYAPKVTPYPAARTAGLGGSGLALLLLGMAALGLAVRRPVWIARLIR